MVSVELKQLSSKSGVGAGGATTTTEKRMCQSKNQKAKGNSVSLESWFSKELYRK